VGPAGGRPSSRADDGRTMECERRSSGETDETVVEGTDRGKEATR
jgi:hypothetical protein